VTHWGERASYYSKILREDVPVKKSGSVGERDFDPIYGKGRGTRRWVLKSRAEPPVGKRVRGHRKGAFGPE